MKMIANFNFIVGPFCRVLGISEVQRLVQSNSNCQRGLFAHRFTSVAAVYHKLPIP